MNHIDMSEDKPEVVVFSDELEIDNSADHQATAEDYYQTKIWCGRRDCIHIEKKQCTLADVELRKPFGLNQLDCTQYTQV